LPVATPDQAANAPNCKVTKREFLVSTTSGGGTVRLREGNYLSPPITLSAKPQSVVFPLDRSEPMGPEEVITIEGKATDMVLTSPGDRLAKSVRQCVRRYHHQHAMDADEDLLGHARRGGQGAHGRGTPTASSGKGRLSELCRTSHRRARRRPGRKPTPMFRWHHS
jgi:hypothetical protein